MPEQLKNARPRFQPTQTQAQARPQAQAQAQRQAWVPVTAEDVQRSRRRLILRWSGVAVVLLLAAGYFYKRTTDRQMAVDSFEAGVKLYNEARYQQAVLNFDHAIDLKSGYVEAYRMRARSQVGDNNPDAAVKDFGKVIRLADRDTRALVERGSIYLDKQDYAKAIADASAALAIDPKLARAYNLRATAVRATGDLAAAVADFTRAVELSPTLDNYFQRAATYESLNQHALAIADLTQAIAIAPDQPHSYFARARSKRALGDEAGAKIDFEKGRQLDGW